MKICNRVYQIKIKFNITKHIERYVYVYLIAGRARYLIDSGVAGCEHKIREYMTQIGRELEEIDTIFLTHSHPDHLGGAAAIQRLSGCSIVAGTPERAWIEDIELQYRERPIPNFYNLLSEPVKIDEFAGDGSIFSLEDGLMIKAIETPGHSAGSTSYILQQPEQDCAVFIGDAVPVKNDIPIFTDPLQSIKSIEDLAALNDLQYYCPAWDRAYSSREFPEVAAEGISLIKKLVNTSQTIAEKFPDMSEDKKIELVYSELGVKKEAVNPLFRRSVQGCLDMVKN